MEMADINNTFVSAILNMHNPGTEFCRVAKEAGTIAPCFAIPAPLAVIPALNFAGWQKNWEPLP